MSCDVPLHFAWQPTNQRIDASRIVRLCLCTIFSFVTSLHSACQADDASQTIDYEKQIKPLFAARCLACHGALKQEAGLRLDTGELARKGSHSGPVIDTGNAAASELIQRVASQDAQTRMPPDGEPLTGEEIQRLSAWIKAGAKSPADEEPEPDPNSHWAFQPVQRPHLPELANPWARNAIDRFIAKGHQKFAVVPIEEANRDTLIRRLYLDLLGVPPTLEELQILDQFHPSDHDQWYESIVDRLLNDPRYGERWGRHWMDVWRYSDWWGLGDQLRNSQYHIWHWRDWIIESLNDDLPYDQMIQLMLAADETDPTEPNKLRATGFLARNYFLFNRNQWMDETVEHVCKSFLGITMNCAKCHDHKYDPIEQVDYYRLRAFFEPYHVRLDMLPGEIDLNRNGLPRVFDGTPELPTYVFVRGQENQPDKSREVTPGVPSILGGDPLHITSVPLPAEAYEPERRPFVADAYLKSAMEKVQAAEGFLATAIKEDSNSDPLSPRKVAARAKLQLAQSELDQLRRQINAWNTTWKFQSTAPIAGTGPHSGQEVQASHHAAIKAQRVTEVMRAQVNVAESKLKLSQATDDKRPPLEKELKSAEDQLSKAQTALDAPIEPEARCSALPGAKWTPTRFFSSLKDDPEVKFHPLSTGRRSALARWIASKNNPLTARVAVNHIWMRHMGTPLVPVVFDFGRKNRAPFQAELLNWLSAEFMEKGWSMKHLHRLIVCSAAYRLGSFSPKQLPNTNQDPSNLSYWRKNPVRLESQVLRDSLLTLANRIDYQIGGPTVAAPDQPSSPRRSMYFFHSNNQRNLFLTTFDEAMVKECYRRDESIVPQQALALINSQLTLELCGPIADRLMAPDTGDAQSDHDFIALAFRVLLARPASETESKASCEAMEQWRTQGQSRQDTKRLLVWALLNHNDFVTQH